MKNKTALQIAKKLGFSHEYEFFDYLIESHTNGNFSSVKEIFNTLMKEDKKRAIKYIYESDTDNRAQFWFYFELL
jgi:uncharacterized protein with ParB-like and HNH nuclease domain